MLTATQIGGFAGAGLAGAAYVPQISHLIRAHCSAGISGEGGLGSVRVRGLLAVYARVFPVWLDDDDPGMARTMAALDRRLRRGETAIHRAEQICDGMRNLSRAIRGGDRRQEKAATPPDTAAPEAPAA